MVAQGGGVVAHLEQQLQFSAGLTDGGAEGSPHAVVTVVKHQHRTLRLARELLDDHRLVKLEVLGDQRTLYPNVIETLKAAEILCLL